MPEPGVAVNSEQFDGLRTAEVKNGSPSGSNRRARARRPVNYKLRDWIFSRQRYWGEPVPMVDCDGEYVPVPEERASGDASGGRELQAHRHRREPARAGRGLGERELSRRFGKNRSARNEHDAAVGRQLLVLPALPRPRQRERVRRAREDRLLDAGRSLRRRRRARGAPPALRALLAQGALRHRRSKHRRAVHAPREPGDDPRRGRREDVQEPRERHQPGRYRPRLRRRQHAHVRDVHGSARGRQAVVHERSRRRTPLPRPRLPPERAGARRRRATGGSAAAAAQDH